MYDSGKIIVGLIVFVGLFTSPFWYDSFNGKALEKPDIVLPTQKNEQTCVESAQYMLSYHMQLLNNWRNDFVRNGQRFYVSSTGKKYVISFEQSCLKCHSNTTEFCDLCHNYMGVTPSCWNCHIEARNLNSLQDINSMKFKSNLKRVLMGTSSSQEMENKP